MNAREWGDTRGGAKFHVPAALILGKGPFSRTFGGSQHRSARGGERKNYPSPPGNRTAVVSHFIIEFHNTIHGHLLSHTLLKNDPLVFVDYDPARSKTRYRNHFCYSEF